MHMVALGFVFSNLVGRIVTMRVCHVAYPTWFLIILPLPFMVAHSYLKWSVFFISWFTFFSSLFYFLFPLFSNYFSIFSFLLFFLCFLLFLFFSFLSLFFLSLFFLFFFLRGRRRFHFYYRDSYDS